MRWWAVLLPVVLLTSCTGVRVYHDYDVQADFSRYKTYDWKANRKLRDGEGAEALAARRVVHRVDQELAAKGLRLERAGRPDLLVSFTAAYVRVNNRTVTSVGSGFGAGPLRFRSVTQVGRNRPTKEGTIVLAFIDERTGEVVWHGEAEGALRPGESAASAEERVAEAVHSLLEGFPPRR